MVVPVYTVNHIFWWYFYCHEFREQLINAKILSLELVNIIYCML